MGAKIVHIHDLNFGVNKKWINKICTQINEGNIDLVLTDFRMPDMNGLEVVKQIKQINPEIPVVESQHLVILMTPSKL